MSYKLNKTDGTILTDLVDGTVDSTSSDLTLIGRNYSGFGEFLNENFIKLLENFSSSMNLQIQLEVNFGMTLQKTNLKFITVVNSQAVVVQHCLHKLLMQ